MKKTTSALALSALLCLAAAAPASAGTIIYNADDTIYAANDDGSGQRALITPDDVAGAVSVYYPWVQPNGSTVVFTARTPYAGYNGLYCGFHCASIYRWDAGQITRMSPATIDCAGDPCAGLDTDPRITADGAAYFFEQVYAEPNSSGSFNSISTPFVAPAVAGGGANTTELKGDCAGTKNYTPSPVDAHDYLYVDCVSVGDFDSAIKRGDSGTFIARDDVEPDGLAWRQDGQAIADAEGGSDPGVWTIDLAGGGPQQLVTLAWDYDHSQYSTSPAFVGNDKVAFIYGDQVRLVPTSCNACSVDATTAIAPAPDAKGLAWTTKSLQRPAGGGTTNGGGGTTNGGGGTTNGGGGTTNGGGGTTNGGGGTTNGGGGTTNGGGTTINPKGAKIKNALKGLAVPFTASAPGTLKLSAQLDAKTAKKLKLIKKGSKPLTIGSGTAKLATAGKGSLKLKFAGKHKKGLAKAKTLKLKLVGTFTPNGGAAQKVTVSVTLKR